MTRAVEEVWGDLDYEYTVAYAVPTHDGYKAWEYTNVIYENREAAESAAEEAKGSKLVETVCRIPRSLVVPFRSGEKPDLSTMEARYWQNQADKLKAGWITVPSEQMDRVLAGRAGPGS